MVEWLRWSGRTIPALVLLLGMEAATLAAEPLAFPINELPFPARLAKIDAEWNIHLQTKDGKLRVVAADDLAYWGRYHETDAGPQILLTDGSVLRADVLTLDADQIVLGDATGLGRGQWDECSLPRAAVSAILYQPPADAAARDALRETLNAYPPHESILLLQGGESIVGQLVAAPQGGRFLAEDARPGPETFSMARSSAPEPLIVPASKVVAYRSFRVDSKPPAAGAVWLGFADGSLINARSLSVQGEAVKIALAAGGELNTTLAGRTNPADLLWSAIEYLQPATPRVQWLSHQQPVGYKQTPFLSVEWPLGVNENVLGSRLRAQGATFLQGLGMPSTSRVAYNVTGYRKLEAEIAIDDAARLDGSVKFKVLLQRPAADDGAAGEWSPAYESSIVRGGDPPLPIEIDLQGAMWIALIVEFADRGDERDWANWLNVRLTK